MSETRNCPALLSAESSRPEGSVRFELKPPSPISGCIDDIRRPRLMETGPPESDSDVAVREWETDGGSWRQGHPHRRGQTAADEIGARSHSLHVPTINTSIPRGSDMSSTTPSVSAYDRRVQMVLGVIEDRTRLERPEATDLAKRILSVIDRVPERIR